MKKELDKIRRRRKRKMHIKKKLKFSPDRPRVTIFKSSRYTYLQAIDDTQGKTMASVSNKEKEFISVKNRVDAVGVLGKVLAERLKDQNISAIAFDRNGYPYHGIVKAIAEEIRKAGIVF
jgi:large subunit ribosomal protein L18